jgi:hypothetical protein
LGIVTADLATVKDEQNRIPAMMGGGSATEAERSYEVIVKQGTSSTQPHS